MKPPVNQPRFYADCGIVMLRELMKAEIEKARMGLDPIGVVRDPDHSMIDTNLTKSITVDYPSCVATKTIEATQARRQANV